MTSTLTLAAAASCSTVCPFRSTCGTFNPSLKTRLLMSFLEGGGGATNCYEKKEKCLEYTRILNVGNNLHVHKGKQVIEYYFYRIEHHAHSKFSK